MCISMSMHALSNIRLHTGNKQKKLATLEIIITLFKVYFRLNTLRLCKNLINAVNSRQFLPFEEFPASQRVTYKYYTGRLAIFDENYVRIRFISSIICVAKGIVCCGNMLHWAHMTASIHCAKRSFSYSCS